MRLQELLIKGIKLKDRGKSGIYLIYCAGNSKGYIGSSKDVYRRWVEHKSRLNRGKHPNIHLQRMWDLYKDTFIWIFLEEVSREDLENVEKTYIENLENDSLVNLADPEKRCCYTVSIETRLKLSKAMKGNKYALGMIHTKEARDKMSKSRKGHPPTTQKLSNQQLIQIKDLLSWGVYQHIIAREFNVSQSAISYVKKKINKLPIC